MVVTITNSGVTFTFSEGEIKSVRSRIGANLDSDSMPASGPLNAMLMDFNGVIKTITVSGKLFNNGDTHLSIGSAATINSQRQWLEKIINGLQTASTFDSNYSSSWNGSSWVVSTILLGDIEFDEQEGLPLELPFTMTLIVGAA